MMPANSATIIGLLKMKVFWIEGCEVTISVPDVTNKILSRDSNYLQTCSCDQSLVALAFLCEKLS